jgi:hypothetical protein
MKIQITLVLTVLLCMVSTQILAQAATTSSNRTRINFDDNWKFHLGHAVINTSIIDWQRSQVPY